MFQTALLRLSSRAAETSRLIVRSISVGELYEGFPNKILQCYLVRDKKGVNGNHPLIPNREGLFQDLTVALGLSLFINAGDSLMPTIADLSESAVSSYYTSMLNIIWKRYPPASGVSVRKGTSHFGKHTAQWQLDSNKQHIAAQFFSGWNVREGSRANYFSNPFPYLLDGAKALACWPKHGGEYQPVRIPEYDAISKELEDKVCKAFFGHIPDNALDVKAKQMILVCVLAKWNKLVEHISAEPNGQFRDPRHHVIIATLMKKLDAVNVILTKFDGFKSACENLFVKSKIVERTTVAPLAVAPPLALDATQSKFPPVPVALPIEDPKANTHCLVSLLSLVSRNTSPQQDLCNFFRCNFMDVYKSIPKVPDRLQSKYRKIKSAVRVMVRFLDSYPNDSLTIEEANMAANRIKSALMNDPSNVKHQGSKMFSVTTPLSTSIISGNEKLLTDKSKPWYQPFPRNTPHAFYEHMYHPHKIYEIY